MSHHNEESALLPRRPTQDFVTFGRGKSLFLLAAGAACALLAVGLFEGREHMGMEAQKAAEVPMLGSKHKKAKKAKTKVEPLTCEDGKYSKRTLKLAYELPFASLFRDTKGQKTYEASSVIVVDDTVYAVCDSSWAISRFGDNLQPFDANNVQVGDPNRDPNEDSGYEALFHDDGTFYVVRESIQHNDSSYHAVIEELSMAENGADDYSIGETCSCEFEFEGDSKGFEGAIPLRDLNNEMVVLGLCEGNYCSETRKNDKGNGRLVAMKKTMSMDDDGSTSCMWTTIRQINVPSSADFRDYSAITMSPTGRVAISSQEESQMWVGELIGMNEDGLWDIDNMEFTADDATLYDFPKNDDCMTIYCNIEGIHWINDEMIIAVSDKMKSKGKQDFRCFDKDQSVHVFVLP